MASHVPSLFLLLSLSTLLLSPSAYSTLFVEHIGSNFTNVKFTDVPINTNITDFHFLLSFANDHDVNGSTLAPPPCTDGNFNLSWNTFHLGPKRIADMKSSNSNVKVAVSLGSPTLLGDSVIFYPCSVDTWVANAVSSVTKIIEEYHLDGIDIHYDNFQSTDTTNFTTCIGQLIHTLKNNSVIQFASISPSPSPSDVSDNNYLDLWTNYKDDIDYVNFQFYAYPASTTVLQLLIDYDTVTSKYDEDKVLISFSTHPSDEGLKTVIFEVAKTLECVNKLNGIVVWNADFSKAKGNFTDEVEAQNILLGEGFQYHEEA